MVIEVVVFRSAVQLRLECCRAVARVDALAVFYVHSLEILIVSRNERTLLGLGYHKIAIDFQIILLFNGSAAFE